MKKNFSKNNKSTKYVWKNGKIIQLQNAKINILTHGLHYGGAVFEGIRAYNTKNGTAVLKLKEHMVRFQYSMKAMKMTCTYTVQQLCQAVIKIIKKNKLKECYIRPLAYFGESNLKVLPDINHRIDVVITCLTMKYYLNVKSINMMVSKYIRIHPQSTICDAKISGHYVNSILASMEARELNYDDALLLDINGNVTEGSIYNIFIVKNNTLITTPKGTILNGITRELIIEIAKNNDIEVKECYFSPQEMLESQEAFCSGTAIEIVTISSLNKNIIGNGETGKITSLILKYFKNIISNKIKSHALTYV